MIANLANVPNAPTEIATWSFSHAAHHRDIIRRIFELSKIKLTEFNLDPMPLDNLGVWGYNHQAMHTEMDAVLQISGFDLTDVNWSDASQRAEWVWLNFNEHRLASDKLGV